MNFLFSDDELMSMRRSSPQQVKACGTSIKDAVLKAVDHLDEAMILDPYAKQCRLVNTEEDFADYIDSCLESDYVVIDTETTGLNFKEDYVVGFSIKCSKENMAIYVPIKHEDMYLQIPVKENLDTEIASAQLKRLEKFEGEFVFYNSTFDVKMIRQWLGVNISTGNDACIMGQLLNENRKSNKLKVVHAEIFKKESTGTFEEIFSSATSFRYVPVDKAYYYGAKDVLLTEELYLYFLKELQKPDNKGIYTLYENVEKPLTQVLCDMEWQGVRVAVEEAESVGEKLKEDLEEVYNEYLAAVAPYKIEILEYAKEHPQEIMEYPPNIQSSVQLVTLFYNILGVFTDAPVFDEEGNIVKPFGKRTVEEKVLSAVDNPICEAIVKYRGIAKLKGTYVDNLSTLTDENGLIHCSFRQLGARTGRQSCANPNLQNIPSDQGAVVRSLFIPSSPDKVLISCDYSAQEMRILAHLSRDSSMIGAYMAGRDLYSVVASIIFHKEYDECLEFVNGVFNYEGKKRRSAAKTILLGLSYGMGIKKLAGRLSITVSEASSLYKTLMSKIPGLEGFMNKCERLVKTRGYVKTIWGRRRRLPEAMLDEYQFKVGGATYGKDMFASAYERIKRSRFEQREEVIQKVEKEIGGKVIDNSKLVSKALRQTVNSVVQGSAADLTKMAMVDVAEDKELKELGFTLLLSVHDEVIGECPECNAKAAGKRLSEVMCAAGEDLRVPLKCDVEITHKWGVKE